LKNKEVKNLVTVSNWVEIEEIKISMDKVCKILGYQGDFTLTPRISSIIEGYIENTHELLEPSYSYVIRDVERVRRSSVFVGGSILFESGVISKLLVNCKKVAIFVATIGHRLEEMVIKLSIDGRVLQSAVLDAIGSVATDSLADVVQSEIAEIARGQGLVISPRFSPGYCDWTIRQQSAVFSAVDTKEAGVNLTEGFLMVPQKSISGIIGIGHDAELVKKYNPCKTCRKPDCIGRRSKI
jgi:hypothetical protein